MELLEAYDVEIKAYYAMLDARNNLGKRGALAKYRVAFSAWKDALDTRMSLGGPAELQRALDARTNANTKVKGVRRRAYRS